jgi:hypothetical protein
MSSPRRTTPWLHLASCSRQLTAAGMIAAASYMLVSCSGGGAPATATGGAAPAPAPTVTLTAKPATVAAGSSATLTWTSTNATSCRASGGWSGARPVAGTESTAAIPTTTSYTLTCTGMGGSAQAAVTVTIMSAPAPTVVLTANPATVVSGGSSTLVWSSTDANSCSASGGWSGSQPSSGTRSTGGLATTTSYTLTCSGPGGTAPTTATVSVVPALQPTVTLTANPTAIGKGGSSILTWSSTGTSSCTASGGWSGSRLTSGSASTGALTTTTSYTLTCSGLGGSAPATVTVAITPTVALTASPTTVASGGSSTLTWSATDATSCTASGNWSGSEPTSGSFNTGPLTATASYVLTCAGPGGNTQAAVAVAIADSITVRPQLAPLTLSQSQQFTVTVPGGGGVLWSVDGVNGGSATAGTIDSGGLYTPGSASGTHTVRATSIANSVQPGTATAIVTDLAGVFTYHNDLARSGQNLQEHALTPATVSSGQFGKLWACPVDGEVYGQPLYVANMAIAGGKHNVLFIVTEHDSVYAFDADTYDSANSSCVTYWQSSALVGTATTVPAADANCGDILTEYGITSTPVIDPDTSTLYFVSITKEDDGYHQRLHRVDLATGVEQAGSPVDINSAVGTTPFSPLLNNQRSGLVLATGGIYIAWSSYCDNGPYAGWLMRYDKESLAQTAVFDVTPNSSDGEGGIWMSGAAPAVDAGGSLYLSTGNGSFTNTNSDQPAMPPNDDFAMSFLKLDPSLAVQDFYTPSNEQAWSDADLDIDSAGVLILPDGTGPGNHPNLLVGSDKQAHLWVMDRASMGGFSPVADNVVQSLTLPNSDNCAGDGTCVFATPGYYARTGTVYLGVSNGPLMAFSLQSGLFTADAQNIAVASSQSSETYGYPSPTPMISASPAGNAMVWVLDNSGNGTDSNGSQPSAPAVLRAYDAANLATTLYSSSTLSSDAAGNAVKFTVPVVANGHVYVAGSHQLTVYGLRE